MGRRKLEKWKAQQLENPKLELLRCGVPMFKVSANGSVRKTHVWMVCETGIWQIKWKTKKKGKQNWLVISQCKLLEGLQSERFRIPSVQKHFVDKANLAFSLVTQDRSLDVVAEYPLHYEQWISALREANVQEDVEMVIEGLGSNLKK